MPVRRLLALIPLLAALYVPSSAGASSSMEFALQDDDVFVNQVGLDRDRALEHASELGVSRIRVNVLWARILVSGGSSNPVYDFSAIDALQEAAQDRGIELQLTITGPAPAWATRNHKVGPVAPDAGKYGAFVKTVVTHFKGKVNRYSLWNEPNWNTWLAPAKEAATLYRGMYRAGYAAAKAADPSAQILMGELAPIGGGRAIAPLKFLRDMFKKGSKPLKADGFAIHPYQFTSAPNKAPAGKPDDVTIGNLPRLTTALDALYKKRQLQTSKGRKLDLFLTEFGYLTVGSRKQSPSRIASWMVAAIKIAERNKRVRQLLQFQLVDGPADAIWHSALLTRQGEPRQAYKALVRALNP
jgi:GH35 family endo-1,4-beta-xylanase